MCASSIGRSITRSPRDPGTPGADVNEYVSGAGQRKTETDEEGLRTDDCVAGGPGE
ncbi:hypothetical protein ACFQPA_00445 [Halomarina halobia]|uniref:Uncharacterized protein n=1 Tax=Halomarina halobia TaxID=3033386 RepID=A0ABD6A8K2_9EURY|nr:hypothetical protein [Halomarina sp. PSR21]